ncbi:ABC transporter permease [Segeticoccus rhizosphaerae]|jgi:ABC-2 type transport system permease protein|uniref:ABC transporter permease n=1 Tax=Segeticoccus rhizosphaerae TaxID=1104777 RepID=UPI0012656D7F|nr:ABC transporter permease [Segeticoccus rhizosphaerae]
MSAVDLPVRDRPGAAAADWRFLRSELRLIFGRRRNQAGLVLLAAVPILIAIAIKVSFAKPGPDAPTFFSSIVSNGLFVSLAALTIEMGLFLPLSVSVIAGDSVAGEANIGTLRYLLAVPVHRTRLLAVKYVAVVIFCVAATVLVAVVGALIGLVLFGGGDVTLLSGTQVGLGAGVGRMLLAALYLALSLAGLAAIGLFLSTLTEQPIGAAIATLFTSFSMVILDSIPQVSWIHPYLLTHYATNFGDLFRDPIGWDNLGEGAFVAVVYIAVFWTAAWARFAGKDVTS